MCAPDHTVLSAMIGTKPPIAPKSSQELFQPNLEYDPESSGQVPLLRPTRLFPLLVATAILISGASPTFAQRSQLGGPEHIAGTKWLYDVSKDDCYYEPSVGSYFASREALHLRQNRWLWNKGYSEAEQGFAMLGLTHNIATQCGAVGKMLALGLMPALLQGIFGQVGPELNQAIDRLRNGGGRPLRIDESQDGAEYAADVFCNHLNWCIESLEDESSCFLTRGQDYTKILSFDISTGQPIIGISRNDHINIDNGIYKGYIYFVQKGYYISRRISQVPLEYYSPEIALDVAITSGFVHFGYGISQFDFINHKSFNGWLGIIIPDIQIDTYLDLTDIDHALNLYYECSEIEPE